MLAAPEGKDHGAVFEVAILWMDPIQSHAVQEQYPFVLEVLVAGKRLHLDFNPISQSRHWDCRAFKKHVFEASPLIGCCAWTDAEVTTVAPTTTVSHGTTRLIAEHVVIVNSHLK